MRLKNWQEPRNPAVLIRVLNATRDTNLLLSDGYLISH
jgi:hypothetical protein